MTVNDITTRLLAAWYRNGMHDIKQTLALNNQPPLTASEMRAAVAGFEASFFAALKDLDEAAAV